MTDTSIEYQLGTIEKIIQEERTTDSAGEDTTMQTLAVREQTSGKSIEVLTRKTTGFMGANTYAPGSAVVLAKQTTNGATTYALTDAYRLPVLGGLGLFFFALVILLVKKQGFFSFVGMVLSFVILIFFLVPQILAGANPVVISMASALGISAISLYLSHGFGVRSHLSFISIIFSLGIATILSVLATQLGQFSGIGTEEAMFLQMGPTASINLRGLFLGGILLGTLSILDDIAVSQVSIVIQLKQAQPKLSTKELYSRALGVGKDHVASLVNTLVLAYAGASLPLFLLFSTANTQPLWVTLNGENIAEEIIRTLVGSIALVVTVPISTALAAIAADKGYFPENSHHTHHHHHHH